MNEVFPYKVCINLARRADRWEQMQVKFDRHHIQAVRRFSAVDGQGLTVPPGWSDTPGAYGCLLSHLQVVREARERGVGSVLIFEDDVVFDARLQANFSRYFGQVPADWDMLYFGALHTDEPIAITENVHKVTRANSTYAYALKHTIFDAFIELHSQSDTAVDVSNRVLQAERACYCFMPHLAWVEDDCSDIQERQKDHWYLQQSLVIHGRVIDHLLKQTAVIIAHSNPTRNNSMTRNLHFLARYYNERLGISAVIVEQSAEPTISRMGLPPGCRYFLLQDNGPLNRGRCFNVGMTISHTENTFLIFADSDIFVEEWDIRGNLRVCQQYDCATGFRRIIELSDTATLKLERNSPMLLTPWFHAKEYASREKNAVFNQLCVFNRRSIEAMGGWEERFSDEAKPLLPSQAGPQLRVFESPNDALRLHRDLAG
jgi:GR25 family glycosyltransferase involved in LPS biosynthesis